MSHLRKGLLVSTASVLALLLALELVLRASGYDPFGKMFAEFPHETPGLLDEGFLRESDHPDLVYELAPHSRAFAWGADIETNASGMRDRDYPREKPPGVRRILALGDSVTFGTKLPVDLLWPAVLERDLAAEGRAIEVLNMGIVGYDTLEEVAFLEHEGLAYEPDLVVVAFHINDVGVASPSREYIQRLRSYGRPMYRIRLLQWLRRWADELELTRQQMETDSEEVFVRDNAERIADLSQDAQVLERIERVRTLLAADEDLQDVIHRYLGWYGSEARIGKLRHALERLRVLAAEHGFDVLVFQVPWLADSGLETVYDAGYAIVRHEVERAGFAWLDPLPATRALGHAELLIEPRDFGHPNAQGHRVLAERVEDWLARARFF